MARQFATLILQIHEGGNRIDFGLGAQNWDQDLSASEKLGGFFNAARTFVAGVNPHNVLAIIALALLWKTDYVIANIRGDS